MKKIYLLLLLLSTCIFFTSCEKELLTSKPYQESEIQNEDSEFQNNNYKITYIGRKEVKQSLKNDLDKIESYNNRKVSGKYYIDVDQIKLIETEDYHSYNFALLGSDGDKIENLVLSYAGEGIYNSYLVRYSFSKEEFLNLDQKIISSSSTEIIPIKKDFSNLFQQIFNNKNMAYECEEKWEFEYHCDQGMLCGANDPCCNGTWDATLVSKECGWGSSGGGSTGSTGGTGTGSNSGSSGTGSTSGDDGDDLDCNEYKIVGPCGEKILVTSPIVPYEEEEDHVDIIVDADFLNDHPCAAKVVQEAYGVCSPLTSAVLDVFEANDGTNLVFSYSSSVSANAETAPIFRYNASTRTCDAKITFRESYIENATDLSTARTTIHESLHATLVYMLEEGLLQNSTGAPISGYEDLVKNYINYLAGLPSNLNVAHHELMAGFVEDIANSLSSFGQSKGYNLPFSYYKSLAWGGLQGTPEFNFLYPKYIISADKFNNPGNVNPEWLKIINTIAAEKDNSTYTYQHPNGTTYTFIPQGKIPGSTPCV